ncbi:MAG: hydrogenase expression/formation protein HypC [Solirubrobacteraceae bacterium]|jgi:hydrogenase maturation factor|nr:hydrogenase expression/formation protein HypC [Solirubrobacteraceae bacterium]
MELEAPLERCITCSDEGLPMRVVSLADETGQAVCVDESGADQSVAVDLLESVAIGDDILVHAGVAIAHMGRCRV